MSSTSLKDDQHDAGRSQATESDIAYKSFLESLSEPDNFSGGSNAMNKSDNDTPTTIRLDRQYPSAYLDTVSDAEGIDFFKIPKTDKESPRLVDAFNTITQNVKFGKSTHVTDSALLRLKDLACTYSTSKAIPCRIDKFIGKLALEIPTNTSDSLGLLAQLALHGQAHTTDPDLINHDTITENSGDDVSHDLEALLKTVFTACGSTSEANPEVSGVWINVNPVCGSKDKDIPSRATSSSAAPVLSATSSSSSPLLTPRTISPLVIHNDLNLTPDYLYNLLNSPLPCLPHVNHANFTINVLPIHLPLPFLPNVDHSPKECIPPLRSTTNISVPTTHSVSTSSSTNSLDKSSQAMLALSAWLNNCVNTYLTQFNLSAREYNHRIPDDGDGITPAVPSIDCHISTPCWFTVNVQPLHDEPTTYSHSSTPLPRQEFWLIQTFSLAFAAAATEPPAPLLSRAALVGLRVRVVES